MMNLPPLEARKSFTGHVGAISDALKLRYNESMHKARELVKRLENELGQEPEDGTYNNIAISHDATWQKRGFTSLYGAVFVLSELTGQVLDLVKLICFKVSSFQLCKKKHSSIRLA